MKRITLVLVGLAALLFFATTADFPTWGEVNSPASVHLSNRFIEMAYEETATPNLVSAVLGDYRAFDTMLETIVVFIAALACFLVMRMPREVCVSDNYYYRHKTTGLVINVPGTCNLPPAGSAFERMDTEWAPHDVVVTTTCRLVIPFIQIYGLYVLAHGHYSPGGGFQGGVIFAASYVLLAVSYDLRTLMQQMSERASHLLSLGGVLIYFGIGLIGLAAGANFLDYDGLAGVLGMELDSGHSLGILLIETGVTFTVTSALVIIFKLLSSRGAVTEGL